MTGQYPRRRETDEEAAQRALKYERRRKKGLAEGQEVAFTPIAERKNRDLSRFDIPAP